MGRDRIIGPGLGVVLLATLTIGSVYWTTRMARNSDTYFYTFSQAMDNAIEKAYGRAWKTSDVKVPPGYVNR
jgi:hypothetical protein